MSNQRARDNRRFEKVQAMGDLRRLFHDFHALGGRIELVDGELRIKRGNLNPRYLGGMFQEGFEWDEKP